jgi:selenocysteine lyase/cysteine desulfurase
MFAIVYSISRTRVGCVEVVLKILEHSVNITAVIQMQCERKIRVLPLCTAHTDFAAVQLHDGFHNYTKPRPAPRVSKLRDLSTL